MITLRAGRKRGYFTVVDMDNLRIDKIRVVLRKEEQQEDA